MNSRPAMRELALGGVLILLVTGFALHPRGGPFLSAQNLSNLSIELAITATLALGMLLVLLPGHIDLSAGSGVGLLGGLAAVLVVSPRLVLPWGGPGWPAPVALAATLAVALLVWWAMGRLIARHRIPSFIITLGGLLVFQGLHWLVIRSSTVPVSPGGTENLYARLTTCYLPPWAGYALLALVTAGLVHLQARNRRARRAHGFPLESGELAYLKGFLAFQGLLLVVIVMNLHKGVPLPLLLLGAVASGVQVLTRHTPFGRHLYAVGGNEEAARLSGIDVTRVVVGAYVLMGAVVALTGFMQTAYGGHSTPTVGKLMELDAIAACVIGGTSLRGGRGTVAGVLFGALIMAVLLNGMTLLAVSPEVKTICRGLVLSLAVWMDVKLGGGRP